MPAIRACVLAVVLTVAACSSDETPVVSTSPAGGGASTTGTSVAAPTDPSTTASVPDSTTTSTTRPDLAGLTYTHVADVDFPMLIVPRTPSESLLGLRAGSVHTFDGAVVSEDPVLTVSVSTTGERGLLGIAVSPEDPGTVYLHYSDPAGDTVVSEFDLGSGEERRLLSVAQPASNHNGGSIQFGPDGLLYLGLGDGGASGDRFGNGQDRDSLLGGIVRIDPGSGATELWAWGLRNPYRFWIDGSDMYIGDVGQGSFEEIDVVSLDAGAPNFGWPITEGLHCFSPRTGCDTTGLTPPVVEVPYGESGTCSIIGGVVSRAPSMPELDGTYFYSDFCGGWLRSFRWDGTSVRDERDWTGDVGSAGQVVGFGVDHDGEVYVLTPDSILRLDPVR